MLEQAPQLPQRHGLLGLLHPKGGARRVVSIGNDGLELHGPVSHDEPQQDADLVVFAPSPAECRSSGWLEAMFKQLDAHLAHDGVAYVLMPRRWRFKLTRLLRMHDLVLEVAMLHVPYAAAGHWLVPLRRTPARYAFATLIPIRAWQRWLALLGLSLPINEKLLAYTLPTVGLVVRRQSAQPIFHWLFNPDEQSRYCGDVVLQPSWRGPDGPIILHCFAGTVAQPTAVAKLSATPKAAERIVEASILAALRGPAARAGAHIPKALRVERVGSHVVFVQSAIRGVPAATLLARKPRRRLPIMERVVHWLARWNAATQVVRTLDQTDTQRMLLEPASVLAPLLQHGTAYEAWLRARCTTMVGSILPFVAAHNDLTMHNVLVDAQGRLGVIDWENACVEALPLMDFFYAMTDAVAATWGYRDRFNAFAACYMPDGTYAGAVSRWQACLCQATAIPAVWAELCFHACWLHHAVNELQASGPNEPRPFLSIVQWLASHSPYTNRSMHATV